MHDAEFLRRFEDQSLPFEQWTHRAHVKVAFLLLRDLPFDEAVDRLRIGIKAYNAAHSVPDGPNMGYHETITCAFARIIHTMMVSTAEAFPVATADEFCDAHPQLMSPKILRLFYSPQQILLPQAKTEFVEPDLTPLPRIE